jgi:hypothetical protein
MLMQRRVKPLSKCPVTLRHNLLGTEAIAERTVGVMGKESVKARVIAIGVKKQHPQK